MNIWRKFYKNILKITLEFYQHFISPFFGSSCRYYPSCSEYAKWQFKHNNFFKATFKSGLRILTCNQLFAGGIDYPLVPCPKNARFVGRKVKIVFWFVPRSSTTCMAFRSLSNT